MDKLVTLFRESSLARFLIPAGFILTIFGLIIFIINKNNQDYIEITATVSNVVLTEEAHVDVDGNQVDATYDINVQYTVDGQEYEGVLSGLSEYNIGDKITIYYDPKDPAQITQSKSLIVPIIMMVGGLAMFVGGIISGVNVLKRFKNA